MNTPGDHDSPNDQLCYIIAFLEGGAVMGSELVAGKMIAPFYGNSLYVWTSVIATTLGGLAIGYFWGGRFSKKKQRNKILTFAILTSTFLTAIMPQLSSFIMQVTIGISVQTGSLISCLVFIFPLLMCFGMVSPLLIRQLSRQDMRAGKSAGLVYFISTLGGVVMTFAMGFSFIPSYGLKMSAYILAVCLCVATLLCLRISRTVKGSVEQ